MDQIESVRKSLNLIQKEGEKKEIVNQTLARFYLNKNKESLSLLLEDNQLNKYVDILFKKGANFEHCYNMSINNKPSVFIELLDFLEQTNQITQITSENINNCLLSSTLSRYKNIEQAEKKHIPLEIIYKTKVLRDKISINYAEYAIFMNLSNHKNSYMTDFLIVNHYEEIIKDKGLHKKLRAIDKKEFSSYIMNKSLSLILNSNNNDLIIKSRKIKI